MSLLLRLLTAVTLLLPPTQIGSLIKELIKLSHLRSLTFTVTALALKGWGETATALYG